MKKLFMEPEVKITKFEYEDIMFVGQTSGVDVPEEGEEFPEWE